MAPCGAGATTVGEHLGLQEALKSPHGDTHTELSVPCTLCTRVVAAWPMALWCVAASGAVQMCAGFRFGMCRYGCSFLEAMLRKLKEIGISVWLDMHALPGGAQARVPYGGVYYPDSQVPRASLGTRRLASV